MAYTLPGATTTRPAATTTARSTLIAPQAPGVTMPRPMAVPQGTSPQGLQQNIQSANQLNQQTYQQRIAALRQLPKGAERALAAQEAKRLARYNQQQIRGFGSGQPGFGIPYGFENQLSPYAQQPAPGTPGGGFTQPQAIQNYQTLYPNLFKTGAFYGAGAQNFAQGATPQAQPQPGGVQDVRPQAFRTATTQTQGVPAATGPNPVPQPPPLTGPRPQAYPQGAPNIFAQRNTTGIDRSTNYGAPYQDEAAQKALQGYQGAQQALLGPLGKVFGLGDNSDFTLTRGDVPLLEAGLNFENVLLAERDRQLGYNELARTQAGVGADPQSQRLRQILGSQAEGNASPEMEQALALASQRAGRQGQFAREATATRDTYGRDTENALRDLRADYARRGVQGNESMLDEALLRQSGSTALNRALADLEGRQDESQRQDITQLSDLAGRNQGFQQASIEQLLGQIGGDDQTRAALGQALANVFLETERGDFDLSGLTTPLKDKIAGLPVAGPSRVKLTNKDVPKQRPFYGLSLKG